MCVLFLSDMNKKVKMVRPSLAEILTLKFSLLLPKRNL